jgi:hypothetical protein
MGLRHSMPGGFGENENRDRNRNGLRILGRMWNY